MRKDLPWFIVSEGLIHSCLAPFLGQHMVTEVGHMTGDNRSPRDWQAGTGMECSFASPPSSVLSWVPSRGRHHPASLSSRTAFTDTPLPCLTHQSPRWLWIQSHYRWRPSITTIFRQTGLIKKFTNTKSFREIKILEIWFIQLYFSFIHLQNRFPFYLHLHVKNLEKYSS